MGKESVGLVTCEQLRSSQRVSYGSRRTAALTGWGLVEDLGTEAGSLFRLGCWGPQISADCQHHACRKGTVALTTVAYLQILVSVYMLILCAIV